MELISVILVFLTFFAYAYYCNKKNYNYWARQGIPYIEPHFPFGNLQGFGKRLHSSQIMHKYYKEMKGKGVFGGIFFFIKPVVLALDLDFIKNILVKDFQYVTDRGTYFNEKDDPLSAHLFSIEGTKWKNLRAKLTPTFTSGKMKMMFPTIISVAEEFKKCLTKDIENKPEYEIKEILAKFTTDVIGTCAFGLECNSLNDPKSKFREMGRKVFEVPRNQSIKLFFMASFSDFSRQLHLKSIRDDVSEFFMQAVKDTIEYREKNNIQRNDFMNLLMQLKNNGKLDDDENDSASELVSLSVEEIAAQAFVFFLAGFETSSTTMSYCLYELALNLKIQEKARNEIKNVLAKYDGKLSYEAVTEMKYVDQIINESLRKYPPGASLIRKVTKDYLVPGTCHILKKNTTIIIPVYAIHHDPEYYPKPEEFNPDRFSDEQMKQRNSFAFLPFGEGPRICIGLRFGMLQARIGLVTLLLNFKFTTCSKTIFPLTFSSKSVVLTPVAGLWLNVIKIKE